MKDLQKVEQRFLAQGWTQSYLDSCVLRSFSDVTTKKIVFGFINRIEAWFRSPGFEVQGNSQALCKSGSLLHLHVTDMCSLLWLHVEWLSLIMLATSHKVIHDHCDTMCILCVYYASTLLPCHTQGNLQNVVYCTCPLLEKWELIFFHWTKFSCSRNIPLPNSRIDHGVYRDKGICVLCGRDLRLAASHPSRLGREDEAVMRCVSASPLGLAFSHLLRMHWQAKHCLLHSWRWRVWDARWGWALSS